MKLLFPKRKPSPTKKRSDIDNDKTRSGSSTSITAEEASEHAEHGFELIMKSEERDESSDHNVKDETVPDDNKDEEEDAPNEKDEEENLDAILANMDIDKDYNAFKSFRRSTDGLDFEDDEEDKSDDNNDNDDDIWAIRLQRSEVFSPRYRPSSEEMKEIRDLETLLGVNKLQFGFLGNSNNASSSKNQWNSVICPSDSSPKNSNNNNTTANNQQQNQRSILLRRSPCLFKQVSKTDDTTESSKDSELVEGEMFLFTYGIVFAKVGTETTTAFRLSKYIPRHFHCAIPNKQLILVRFPHDNNENSCHLEIETTTKGSIIVECGTECQRESWLDAFRETIVQYHLHNPHKPQIDSNAGTTQHDNSFFGWQYQYVYTPGFTMAVTTEPDPCKLTRDQLNQLDKYNGYAPIHYAVKHNHVPALERLLQAGADPNLKNSDGQTPMSIAVRDELPQQTINVLKSHGAIPVTKEENNRGELFGKVEETRQYLDYKKEKEAQEKQDKEAIAAAKRAKAQALTADMKNNMAKLQERGDQIDLMHDKAYQLNEGAEEFGSLAKQLKAKVMKKKWYHLT